MSLTKEDIEEIKSKNLRLFYEASILTNLSYSLVDIANSMFMETDTRLRKVGAALQKDEKRKFNNVRKQGQIYNTYLKDLAKAMYKIENADIACSDTDKLYDLLMLILSRTGSSEEAYTKIRAMIFNCKTMLDIYDKR